jgi:hypothetical protein
MKKSIIGYIPAAIIFAVPASVFLLGMFVNCLIYQSEYGSGYLGMCALCILIFTFLIGGLLNLAFLVYAGISGRLMNFYDGTSEGIVSKGGVVTAVITLVIQIGIITIMSYLAHDCRI